MRVYDKRGASENFHKELKSGFGMRWMPSGKFSVNAAFFAIGVLAMNAAVVLKQKVLPEAWRKKTIATLRWELLEAAGRWVRHARERVLRVGGMSGERWEVFRGAYRTVFLL